MKKLYEKYKNYYDTEIYSNHFLAKLEEDNKMRKARLLVLDKFRLYYLGDLYILKSMANIHK